MVRHRDDAISEADLYTTEYEPEDSMPPVVEPDEPQALAVMPSDSVAMFERLATNPDVNVEKLERLIAMQERIIAHNAKAAFDSAFSDMQGEIPIITERGEIIVNGQLRSKYARLEDILAVVKPILQKHGFAIRHRNEFADGKMKIVGILSHRSGHSEQDEFVTDADTGPGRNAIQSIGSARSYGQRYTTVSLLNIATRGSDDDGHGSEKAKAPAEPDGYELWRDGMSDMAEKGLAALQVEFQKSKREYREYITKIEPLVWARIKTKATAAGGGK